MSDPIITSVEAQDTANDLAGDASNEYAFLYCVIMSGILASFGAVCKIWFHDIYWISVMSEEYRSLLISNYVPLTFGYVIYLAFPDNPLVTSAILFLIASSGEGPWWKMWRAIDDRLQQPGVRPSPYSWEFYDPKYYFTLGVKAVFTLVQMFAQAFLLPKVYAWADSQEKFAPIYM